jgi:two-component system C4-dicarboxylate transport response regulator DctD
MTRDWPGNVRELRNVADALVLGVGPQWVSPHASTPATGNDDAEPSLTQTVDNFERSLIFDALQRHAGNVVQTAKSLRIAKTTLTDKIKKHGLGKNPGNDLE